MVGAEVAHFNAYNKILKNRRRGGECGSTLTIWLWVWVGRLLRITWAAFSKRNLVVWLV
jgi:hypothetical protein